MCTYLYQNLKNIKSRMIHAITHLPPSVDIAQQLSSRTEVSGSLRLCNNLYHSSQQQSLMLTVNVNDLDKSLALDRAADISTLHHKCSQLSNKRLDQCLLFGHFADHNFVPNPVAGNMTMKITPPLSRKSTMSVAKQAQPLHPLSSSQPVNVLPFLPTVTTHNSCASYECSPHDTPHAIEKPSRSLLKLAAKKGLESSLTRFKTPKMKPHRKKKYKTMCLRAYKYPTKRTLQVKEMPTLSDNLCKLSGRSKSPLHFFKSKKKSYTMTHVNILYQYFFQWLHMYMYLHIQNCEDNNTLPSRDSLINSIVVTRKGEFTIYKLHVTPPTFLPVDCEVGFKDDVLSLAYTTSISFESGVFSVILNLIHVCLCYIPSVSSNLYYGFELSEQARGISEGQLIEKCCRYQTLVHLQRSQHMYATTEVQLHGSQTTITNECGLLSSRHGSEIHSYTLNHEEKSNLASVQDNKGNCGCTESSMDKNKNEEGDTDCDKSDESGRGDLEDRRGNDGENRDSNSDNEGEGYLGEEEDSTNNEERERERTRRKCRGRKKMKKRRRSSTKKNLRLFRYVDHPIALVRGLDDDRPEKETNPPTSQAQQEMNHHPPLAMQIVDGVAVHTRICPPLQPRVNQQPVGAHFIPQVQQQRYHHSLLLQTQQEQEDNPNSSFAATPCVPTKETCHQCTSATAHGSVLVQPQVVHPPRVTIETQTEGTLIIVPQPLANVSPSSAIDSGLGTTNLTSSGHQSHPLPQNNHFQHVSTPARQRRSENSSINEPRWNYATAHVGAPIMNHNHESIQSHDFSHYVQVGTTDDEMQNGPHANEPLQANNEQVNQGQEDTEWNYANTIARGYESAEAEEGECLPTHSAIIAIPHGGQRRPRLQFAAISPEQNSSSSGAAHGANSSPLNLVTASLPPVISSFGTLMEASIEPLIRFPNGARPIPVAHMHGVPQAYQPRPGNPPVPTLPHPQGVMMFGALEQPADDAQLVGVPGPVVNNVLPRQNAVNAHIPSMIHSSTHQAGNSLSFHALVEDSQPRELFTVL